MPTTNLQARKHAGCTPIGRLRAARSAGPATPESMSRCSLPERSHDRGAVGGRGLNQIPAGEAQPRQLPHLMGLQVAEVHAVHAACRAAGHAASPAMSTAQQHTVCRKGRAQHAGDGRQRSAKASLGARSSGGLEAVGDAPPPCLESPGRMLASACAGAAPVAPSEWLRPPLPLC